MSNPKKALESYADSAIARVEESPWLAVTPSRAGSASSKRYVYELPGEFHVDIGRVRAELAARDWTLRESEDAYVFEKRDFIASAGLLAEPAQIDAMQVAGADRPPGDSPAQVLYILLTGIPFIVLATFLVDEFGVFVKLAIVLCCVAVYAPTVVALHRRHMLPHQVVSRLLSRVDVEPTHAIFTLRHDGLWPATLDLGANQQIPRIDKLYRSELARVVSISSDVRDNQ
jgi:hypothetical protein